jgi:hypothetical protein
MMTEITEARIEARRPIPFAKYKTDAIWRLVVILCLPEGEK